MKNIKHIGADKPTVSPLRNLCQLVCFNKKILNDTPSWTKTLPDLVKTME